MSDRNLRLQVVLNAVDKITRPFKSAQASTGKLATALKASKQTLKNLNDQAAKIDGFRKTRAQLAITEKNLAAARQEAAKLAAQFVATQRPTAQQARVLEQAKNHVKQLQQSYNGLRLSVQKQREALNNSGISTQRLGEAQRRLRADSNAANASLARQQAELRRLGERQQKLNALRSNYRKTMETRDRMAGQGAAATATGAAMLYTSRRTLMPGFEFDQGMSRVQALTRLEKSSPEFQALREQARKLGSSTAFTANDVAQGQSFYAMAGFNPDQIRAAMPGTLDMSTASGTDLATTADIGSNILTGFKLPADQMSRVGDSLVATFTRSNTNLQMLGETMKYVAPVAATLGIDLETATAAAGKLGDAGIQGSMAGTSLRSILSRLASPPKAAAKALQELNMQTRDAQGNLRALPDLLEEMHSKTSGMGNARQTELFKKIAGDEAFSGLSVLVDQAGKGELQQLIRTVSAAKGEAAKVANTMSDNLGGDLKGLASAWQDIGITMYDSVEKPLRSLTRRVTAFTARVGQWMAQHPRLTKVLTATALALGALMAILGAITLALAAVLGPLAILRLSFSVLGVKAVSALLLLKGAVSIVGNAVLWLGRIMLVNPVLAIIAAIAAAGIYIWQNWETLGPKFTELWNRISQGVSEAWNKISGYIAARWDEITGGLKALPERFRQAGTQMIDSLISGISQKWGELKAKITSLTDYLPDWMQSDKSKSSTPPSAARSRFAGLYDNGGFIPAGQFGIAGENGPEIVNGPAMITSRRRTAALAASAALAMGMAAVPVAARPLHPMSQPAKTVSSQAIHSAPGGPVVVMQGKYEIQVIQQPGQNAQDVVAEVMRRLEDKERRAQARARSAYADRGDFDA